jgi:tripartite-type tricarboxylate transporter receptor subunit TctC
MLLFGAMPSPAQVHFPEHPVKIVMPLPAGSALDVVMRLVGEQLARRWGQRVVIENRPGGIGLVAAQAVATAPPDGHTLLGGAAFIFTILPAGKDKLPIDVNRDFTQIGLIGGGPMYLAVSPKLGVSSLSEFAELARVKPQGILIGTNAAGTLPHFAALALARKGGIPVTVVPYGTGGTVEAIRDILGGRVHATIEAMSGLRGAIEAGDLKVIAVMSPERISDSLPTVAEAVPGLTAVGWMSLAAPAGTPEAIIRRLSDDLRTALEAPIVGQRLDEFGMRMAATTPAQTKAFVEGEQQLWWPIVKEAALK